MFDWAIPFLVIAVLILGAQLSTTTKKLKQTQKELSAEENRRFSLKEQVYWERRNTEAYAKECAELKKKIRDLEQHVKWLNGLPQ